MIYAPRFTEAEVITDATRDICRLCRKTRINLTDLRELRTKVNQSIGAIEKIRAYAKQQEAKRQ